MRRTTFAILAVATLAAGEGVAGRVNDYFTGHPPVDRAKGDLCHPLTTSPVTFSQQCEAALASGERNALIFASTFSFTFETDQSVNAGYLARLQPLADKGDAPVAYLLGSRYVEGKGAPRDLARGRAFLEIAVRGGNLAAHDLLAGLLIEGLGGPVDVNRGLALLRAASVAGAELAPFRLASVLMENRRVDRNLPAAREALAPLAQQNNARAKALLARIDMIEQASRSTNIMIVPKPDGSRPDAIKVSAADMPPVPPSLGFDKDLHALWRRPLGDNPEIITDLKARLPDLPTSYIYELARRVSFDDPVEGYAYFFLAQMRTQYDAKRCDDQTGVTDAHYAWQSYTKEALGPINQISNVKLHEALDKALSWEAALPGTTRPWWLCFHGSRMTTAALAGSEIGQWLKPEAEWPTTREASREAVKAMVDRIIDKRAEEFRQMGQSLRIGSGTN